MIKGVTCVKKLNLFFGLLLVLWFVVHSIVVIGDGLRDELSMTDVGVVLGNKVELDGQPSKRLVARLDKAVELYESGYIQCIIVSGGIGKEGFDEGEVMKVYLVDQGIPEDKIIVDSNGYNTHMTAENTKAIMEDMNLQTVTVITQYHHVSRTKLAFRKLGFDNVASAGAKRFEARDIYSIFREFFAYYKYLLD